MVSVIALQVFPLLPLMGLWCVVVLERGIRITESPQGSGQASEAA
ncbi:MAG: hypothetical protein ABI036_11615 [Fibrobacteria bacterium]